MSSFSLNGCATLKDSLLLGSGAGLALGAGVGATIRGDQGENTIKGAVLGGVLGIVTSYFLHQSLESRDDRVRRETLMNLENYDVLGVPKLRRSENQSSENCQTTETVDGKLVLIPCHYVNGQLND